MFLHILQAFESVYFSGGSNIHSIKPSHHPKLIKEVNPYKC